MLDQLFLKRKCWCNIFQNDVGFNFSKEMLVQTFFSKNRSNLKNVEYFVVGHHRENVEEDELGERR
jgi:hypothetical protein